MNNDKNTVRWRNVKNQFVAAIISMNILISRHIQIVLMTSFIEFSVNLATSTFGLFEGWITLGLTSSDTPFPNGTLSMEEISWIASIQCIGALFGNIVFGYIINRYGRRWPIIIVAAPLVACWLAICFAQNVYYLYIARFFGGFFCCGGIYTIVPLFLTEIANDKLVSNAFAPRRFKTKLMTRLFLTDFSIRGVITATHVLSQCIGSIIAYIFGSFLDYKAVPILVIVITVTYAVLIYLFLPETPLFLVKQGKIGVSCANIIMDILEVFLHFFIRRFQEAKKSIVYYQNIRQTEMKQKTLEIEIIRLKSIINDIQTKCDGNSFDWSELRTRIAQRAILIGIVLMALNQLSGVVAMMSYSAKIFEAANSALPPNLSIIVIGVVQLISNIITMNLVDRAGRRVILCTHPFNFEHSRLISHFI